MNMINTSLSAATPKLAHLYTNIMISNEPSHDKENIPSNIPRPHSTSKISKKTLKTRLRNPKTTLAIRKLTQHLRHALSN